jgi:drug/metabolite transporter (DMT)-like permease
MRMVSGLGCDPAWATCNKELVTVLVVAPWIVAAVVRRQMHWPPAKVLAWIVLMGLATQLGGNLWLQWSYGVIGLAVAIATNVGAMLAFSAALGRLALGERVSLRSAGAMALLILALASLALGAQAAANSLAPTAKPLLVAGAVIAVVAAGFVYAALSATIRHVVTTTTPLSIVLVTITGMGVLTLGPISLLRLGPEVVAGTPWQQYAWIYAAGVCNCVGFMSIVKGLQLTTVLHANVVNASQVAMAAVAGIALFKEPWNAWLVSGIALTIAGVMLKDQPSGKTAI